uniref:DUF X8 domain-containing protein n=1 Tax=Steinernema glaseri TaxID=37863 RepID=A0A1I7ZIG2_9BILA
MRLRSLLLLASVAVLLLLEGSSASRALRGYQERIKAMREAINARDVSASSASVSKSVSKSSKSNPQKTKKYKCVLVEDEDEESEETPKPSIPDSPEFDAPPPLEKKNMLWPSNSFSNQPIKSRFPSRNALPAPTMAPELMEYPKARAMPKVKPLPPLESYPPPTLPPPPVVTTVRPNVPTDKNHQPLILSPQHCNQVKYYANMYGVEDVRTWVHKNCSFAKMYLPKATCAEIDILVASCYH